ncbi:MAG TPA: RagB/SusD family nutrient uptake outer membrane protein [Chryseosolibacter sp.]
MNKIKLIIALAGLGMTFYSCQDEWLDRYPLDETTEAAFFKKPGDFTVFVNRFHPQTGRTYSWGDLQTDVQITNNSLPEHFLGLSTINDGPGYNYSDIRRVNYMLEKARQWDGEFAGIKQAVGEAHYFRAFFYWRLLRDFGDVQWIDKVLTMDSPELFTARAPRNVIADNILADLDTAVMYLMPERGNGYSRLNKWFALLLQSRVALYEGTWEKYHAGTPFGVENANPDKYLNKAAAAAKEIMDSGLYSLYNTGNPESDYYKTFNMRDHTNNPEAMRWTKMDVSMDITAHRKLFTLATPDSKGLTKSLVDQYLCIDGEPIAVSDLYQGDNTIEEEATNRDPRFAQTVWTKGSVWYAYDDGRIDYYDKAFQRLFQDNIYSSPTGYQQRKQYLELVRYHSSQEEESPTVNNRYAEVLLNYAEAKAELGTLSQEDLDMSINLLRDRVAMPHLGLGAITFDPNWQYPDLSPIINEVRRERLVELVSEDFRSDDLFRWAAMKYLIGTRPLGAKADQFNNDPGLPVTADGNLDILKNAFPSGYQFNLDRDYLWPIPEGEIILNPKLGQNPEW